MSIIQTTATTQLGAYPADFVGGHGRRHPADGEVWIPWAVMAGERAEQAWGGSHAVLEVGDVRTDAPLWEARRTPRRTLGATAVAFAIAVALAWVALGLAAYASLAQLG